MTSFVHPRHSHQHQGAERVESAIEAVRQVRLSRTCSHGLATVLLSALAASAMVAADQLMESAAEGHLMAMCIALWVVAFAALAFFAGAARQTAERIKTGLDGWSARTAQARADQRLWTLAQQDARVMADLQTAMLRSELQADDLAPVVATARRVRRIAVCAQ